MEDKKYVLTVEKSIMVSEDKMETTYNIYPGSAGRIEDSGDIMGLSFNELCLLHQLIGQVIQETKGGTHGL